MLKQTDNDWVSVHVFEWEMFNFSKTHKIMILKMWLKKSRKRKYLL